MTEIPTKFTLDDRERALLKRRPEKSGVLGVVYFRGPRGRQYRPTRTRVQINEQGAREAVNEIRGRQYANGAFPSAERFYRVDFIGRVLGEVQA